MKEIDNIKKALEKNLGRRVMLRAVKGRKRFRINSCVIESVYPGIFVVKTVDANTGNEKRISFGYSDLLTKTIEIKLYKDENAG